MREGDQNKYFPGTPEGVSPRVDVRKDRGDFDIIARPAVGAKPLSRDPHPPRPAPPLTKPLREALKSGPSERRAYVRDFDKRR